MGYASGGAGYFLSRKAAEVVGHGIPADLFYKTHQECTGLEPPCRPCGLPGRIEIDTEQELDLRAVLDQIT